MNEVASITRNGGASYDAITTSLAYDAADRLTTVTDQWVNNMHSGGGAPRDVRLRLRRGQPPHERKGRRGDGDL